MVIRIVKLLWLISNVFQLGYSTPLSSQANKKSTVPGGEHLFNALFYLTAVTASNLICIIKLEKMGPTHTLRQTESEKAAHL